MSKEGSPISEPLSPPVAVEAAETIPGSDGAEERTESDSIDAAEHRRARMVSRRAVVLGAAGAVVLGGSVAGLTFALNSISSSSPSGHASPYTGDLQTIAQAAAMENQAVSVYRALLAAARAGKLGPQVPAFTSLAQACATQHAAHAAAWNKILRVAGVPAITGVPLSGYAAVLRSAAAASTAGQAMKVALPLENQAEQAYAAAAGSLRSAAGIAAAAGIAPVEAMHATILEFLLGELD